MAIYDREGRTAEAFGDVRETAYDIARRFFTAANSVKPSAEQLAVQFDIAKAIESLAVYANQHILDSRHKSLALTHLEDALMRFGKAIFQPLEDHEVGR